MSNLAKLLAAQKSKRENGVNADANDKSGPTDGNPTPAEQQAQPDSGAAELESIQGAPSTDGAGEKSDSGTLGGLGLLKRAASHASAERAAPKSGGGLGGILGRGTKPADGNPPADTGATPVESRDDGPAEFSLDDIASLDESTTPSLTPRGSTSSGFDDEIEATAPDRELPADLESQQLLFVESLDNIYQVLNDPEMFGQSVRLIMMELQENPEYIKLVSDQDVHVMIRAMRNTMGLARIKKQARSRKTTESARSKKAAVKDSDMELLGSLLGGLGDDD